MGKFFFFNVFFPWLAESGFVILRMTDKKAPNTIVQLTFQFALQMIDFAVQLKESHHFIIANQLVRSGTAIGASVREAQHSESRKDFIHKMKIAAKEADETCYWLELCNTSSFYPNCDLLIQRCQQICRILSKIIFTSRQRLSR
jgi:four helix bundle protein